MASQRLQFSSNWMIFYNAAGTLVDEVVTTVHKRESSILVGISPGLNVVYNVRLADWLSTNIWDSLSWEFLLL